jgi:hypothetical protein
MSPPRQYKVNQLADCLKFGNAEMVNKTQADTKFLSRVLLGLVFMTLVTGGMAGLTAVEAMTEATGQCYFLCQ